MINEDKAKEVLKYQGMIFLLNEMHRQGKVTEAEYRETLEKIRKEAAEVAGLRR